MRPHLSHLWVDEGAPELRFSRNLRSSCSAFLTRRTQYKTVTDKMIVTTARTAPTSKTASSPVGVQEARNIHDTAHAGHSRSAAAGTLVQRISHWYPRPCLRSHPEGNIPSDLWLVIIDGRGNPPNG